MTNQIPAARPVSRQRILAATALAAALAAVVLVVAVLPAEYGIDPLGTGKALGLTALAGTSESAAAPAPALPPQQQATFQQDVYTVELRPFEGVEYKYRLEQGASLVYSWTATGLVGFEFHGEPDGAPKKYFDSYAKGEGTDAHGGFTAAKPGIHGWYWVNKGAKRIIVTLKTAGFYAASTEFRDGDQIERKFPAR